MLTHSSERLTVTSALTLIPKKSRASTEISLVLKLFEFADLKRSLKITFQSSEFMCVLSNGNSELKKGPATLAAGPPSCASFVHPGAGECKGRGNAAFRSAVLRASESLPREPLLRHASRNRK